MCSDLEKPPSLYGTETTNVPPRERRTYEVEHRAGYGARPGFRIAELQIGRAQEIPWHYHSQAQDTFYVISGAIRISAREPEEEVHLLAGQTYTMRPRRPHRVANAGDTSALFLVLQRGERDFIALA
jgi:mannose-6-phosphate isomerase-like protein (cupin superfamily)